MNFYQTSESYSLTTTYAFGDSLRQALSAMFSYNNSQNITGRLQDASAFGFNVTGNAVPVDVYTGMLSHTLQWRTGFSFGYVLNYNQSEIASQQTVYYGPGLTASKALFGKKLNLQSGATYNQQLMNGELANHVMNLRLGANFSPEIWDKKYGKLTMSFTSTYTQKFAVAGTGISPKNLAIIANINYGF
jgi:hypothetical protein